MRVYGRIFVPAPPSGIERSEDLVAATPTTPGNYRWVVLETAPNGSNDYCYVTALIQCLRLNLGESPFYARYGVPAAVAVHLQLQPDFYINYIQKFYARFFASLIIAKRPQRPTNASFAPGARAFTTPVYDISIVRKDGSIYNTQVAL